ncbi:MAG: riboflavin biosynthesis protein RibF [Planctomycetes bacterium RBG_16_43_13]|nr:MAG: riboflavin biosynthesis protein RibF [Planctomycetes bacterium RBG_16_43_13]
MDYELFPPAIDNIEGSIVSWGVFDGVHRGHRKVIEQVVEWAKSTKLTPIIVTFDRHPQEVLYNKSVPLLIPIKQRIELIQNLGVEYCIVIPFTEDFASNTAEEFVRDIVVGKLKANGIVLGFDSMFGKDREGNFELLRSIADKLKVGVRSCEPEQFNGRPVSSSLIRELISNGRLDDAKELLGRQVSVVGTVISGDGRGKGLGFPTANIMPLHSIRPPTGVYGAEVVVDGKKFYGVTNIGKRPTFHVKYVNDVVEIHILDFSDSDIYGKEIEIRILFKIRDEKKFASSTELAKQIKRDITVLRERIG